MPITAGELAAVIGLDDSDFVRGMVSAQARFKRFGDELQGIGARLSIGITAPLTLMGAAIVKVGTDYEKSMNIFQSVTRASADEMARAAQVAQKLGADMKLPATSAGDAAKAMTELAKGGLTASQAMDATRGTLQLAAAAMIDEARAAEITANALNAFGLEAAEAGRVSDLLAAAANASSAEIDDIALSMQQASAVFASAHIPIEDLTAAIGLMANAGIKGSDAGTSLKTMIIALSAPTDKASETMKQLGINIFDAQGKFIPFRGMIEQVSGALKGMSEEQQAAALKTIFGTDALRAANIVMAKGVDAFDEMSKAVGRTGAAQELAEARAKGLSGAVDGLVSQLETLALKIYQSVAPGLESLVRMLADLVGNLGEADKAVLQAGVTLAAVFAAAGPVALGIGVIVSLIGGPLTLAIVGLTAAVGVLAAEWVLDMNKMSDASTITADTTKQKFIDLATAIGTVMDAISFAANLVASTVKTLGALTFAAFTPIIFLGLALEEGFSKAAKTIETTWTNLNKSIERSNDAMASALEGRWSTMLGNLVRGMGAAQQAITRGWGETAASFAARSKINWGASLTPDANAQKAIQDAMRRTGNAAAKAFGDGTKGGGAAATRQFGEEVIQELERLREQLDLLAKSAEFFVNEALEETKKLMQDLPLPVRKFADAVETAASGIVAQGKAFKDGIGSGRAWLMFIKETKSGIESHNRTIANMKEVYDDLSRQLPHAWNVIIEGFTRGISNTSIKVKQFAADIITVFDTMPGKWGQSLNRALDEVNRWISFIDSAIKLIQRMLGDKDPGGLGSILSQIGGIFKKTSKDVQEATQDIGQGAEDWGSRLSTEMSQAASGIEGGASRILAGLSSIAAGVLAFAGVKGAGAGVGAIGGALGALGIAGGIAKLLGVTFKSLFTGPAAPFVIAGIGVGAILGAIFGRKSELQKAQEAAALQQAKDAIKLSMQNVLKGAQEVIQSATESFMKALEFFDKLDEFTAVRKAKFQEFWKAMTRLMNGFFELAKQFVGQSMPQLKAVAETIGPIAEAIGSLPMAFEAINNHFGVAQSAIDRFFADFSVVMEAFFARSEVWIAGISKRAFKVANRLNPVVELISAFGTAMTSLTDVKEPTDEMFAIFDRVIDKIITHVANLSLKFDKAVLKTMANFAEKAGAALAIWKEAIESIRATVDVPAPSEAGIDNVVAGIELFVAKLSESVNRLITTDLARVAAFANTIAPIAAAIKAWAETAEVVRGYTQIAAEVWEAIVADFERGLVLLNLLILDAQIYVEKATTFKTLIEQGTSLIDAALRSFGSGISAASSALTGGLPQGGTAIGTASASSMAPMSAASRVSATSSQTIQVNVTVQGSVIAQQQLNEEIMRQLEQGRRSGRISPSVFTGNLATVR